jgi:hypothetical protein
VCAIKLSTLRCLADGLYGATRVDLAADGEAVEGGKPKLLLQIFSRTVIGPIFFEFTERKGDEGFGEGNFRFHNVHS